LLDLRIDLCLSEVFFIVDMGVLFFIHSLSIAKIILKVGEFRGVLLDELENLECIKAFRLS
jgi:hypothetical protein